MRFVPTDYYAKYCIKDSIMRVVKEINHQACKITIFNWNGKYLIKLEQGDLEQTYKISEMDVIDVSDLDKLLDKEFISSAIERFKSMAISLARAEEKLF